jgi:pimeloyl-ACP methyl ester carboxylesterase
MKKFLSLVVVMCTLFCFFLITTPAFGCHQSVFKGVATSADQAQIAYTVYQKAVPCWNDVTLVFVHGWACSQEYWKDQIAAMVENYTVVTVDLAGHGKSTGNRENCTVEAYARDVTAVIRDLHLQKVILVGHSMGASVILETALLLPYRVIGLVGAESYHNVAQDIPAPEMMEPLYQLLATDFASGVATFLAQTFVAATNPEFKQWIINDAIAQPPTVETAISSMKQLYLYNYNKGPLTAFRRLSIPIRAINSDAYPYDINAGKDNTVSFDMVHMSNVGHYLMMEDPDTFNSLLKRMIYDIVCIRHFGS